MDASGCTQLAGNDPSEAGSKLLSGTNANGNGWHGEMPKRDKKTGALKFADAPDFCPNLTPPEVLKLGSFGGGYFRPITSGVTGAKYNKVWKELPEEWLENLDIKTQVASMKYTTTINKYKVNCGAKDGSKDTFGQAYWEKQGWINGQDPYGWFHWYCRFYQGRRSDDDERQISRWAKAAGQRGRWKQNLVGKVLAAGKQYDDESVSPVVRQTLQHWGYNLTLKDFEQGAKRVRTHGASYIPKAALKHVMANPKSGKGTSKKESGAVSSGSRKRKPKSQEVE